MRSPGPWNLRPCCYSLEFACRPAYLQQHHKPELPSSVTLMTRIILYTTPYCGYCRAVKHLLNKKGILPSPRSM